MNEGGRMVTDKDREHYKEMNASIQDSWMIGMDIQHINVHFNINLFYLNL